MGSLESPLKKRTLYTLFEGQSRTSHKLLDRALQTLALDLQAKFYSCSPNAPQGWQTNKKIQGFVKYNMVDL